MRFYILPDAPQFDPADQEWFYTQDEAYDAAYNWSEELNGIPVKVGTFNLGGPSYTVAVVTATV